MSIHIVVGIEKGKEAYETTTRSAILVAGPQPPRISPSMLRANTEWAKDTKDTG